MFSFILLHIDIQQGKYHFLKRLSFSNYILLAPLSKIKSNLFLLIIILWLAAIHFYQTVSKFVPFCSRLLWTFKVLVVVYEFYDFPISMKNIIKRLEEYIVLGCMHSLLIFIPLIYKHRIYLFNYNNVPYNNVLIKNGTHTIYK